MRDQSPYLQLIIGIFVMTLILGTLLIIKPIQLFGLDSTGGVLIIPVAFALVGIVNELYGPELTQLMIFIGIGCVLLTAPFMLITLQLPKLDVTTIHTKIVFTAYLHNIFLSTAAYTIGGFSIAWIQQKLQDLNINSILARLVISPLLGQIITVIAFYIVAIIYTQNYHILITLLSGRLLIGIIYQVALSFPLYYLTIFLRKIDKIATGPGGRIDIL